MPRHTSLLFVLLLLLLALASCRSDGGKTRRLVRDLEAIFNNEVVGEDSAESDRDTYSFLLEDSVVNALADPTDIEAARRIVNKAGADFAPLRDNEKASITQMRALAAESREYTYRAFTQKSPADKRRYAQWIGEDLDKLRRSTFVLKHTSPGRYRRFSLARVDSLLVLAQLRLLDTQLQSDNARLDSLLAVSFIQMSKAYEFLYPIKKE